MVVFMKDMPLKTFAFPSFKLQGRSAFVCTPAGSRTLETKDGAINSLSVHKDRHYAKVNVFVAKLNLL